jgi:hypothetical protein
VEPELEPAVANKGRPASRPGGLFASALPAARGRYAHRWRDHLFQSEHLTTHKFRIGKNWKSLNAFQEHFLAAPLYFMRGFFGAWKNEE